jgi:hypothetical protein
VLLLVAKRGFHQHGAGGEQAPGRLNRQAASWQGANANSSSRTDRIVKNSEERRDGLRIKKKSWPA